MMIVADDTFSDLVLLFCKNLSPPRRRGRPTQICFPEVWRKAAGFAECFDMFDMFGDVFHDAAKWRSKIYIFFGLLLG